MPSKVAVKSVAGAFREFELPDGVRFGKSSSNLGYSFHMTYPYNDSDLLFDELSAYLIARAKDLSFVSGLNHSGSVMIDKFNQSTLIQHEIKDMLYSGGDGDFAMQMCHHISIFTPFSEPVLFMTGSEAHV